ncbi:DUF4148 domain-containing protein [Bordetella muralis]|uniref:DUF4148 domain-containing protein n=1 Tax=Bordetella muralis TaxID=1649130 RepID=UPI0039EE80AE
MNRFAILTIASVLFATASGANADPLPGGSANVGHAALTRAEVQADLAAWKRAGMERLQKRAEVDPGVYATTDYRAHYAEYVRLRSGPDFAAEVANQQANS